EADPQKVDQIFAQIPGAAELANQHTLSEPSGGLMGSLSGFADRLSGGRAGVILAGMAQIEATNISVVQLKNIGSALLAYISENADPRLVKEVFDSIPWLREHFAQ